MSREQELYAIAPGFISDREDNWATFLEAKDRAYLENQRLKYFKAKDLLDTMSRKKRDEEAEKKYQAYVEKRNNHIDKLVSKIEELKEEALRRKKRKLEEEVEVVKKRRTEYINDNDFSNVELDDDCDYIPKEFAEPKEKKPKRIVKKVTLVNNLNDTTKNKSVPEAQPRDKFYDGIKETDLITLEVMRKNRSEICKYDCRDQALKVLDSLKFQDGVMKGLDAWSSHVNKIRSLKENLGRDQVNM